MFSNNVSAPAAGVCLPERFYVIIKVKSNKQNNEIY